MILGGELSLKNLTFNLSTPVAANNTKTAFAARSNFFFVPPYSERIDVKVEENLVHFCRNDGGDLYYEDVKFILNKSMLFQLLTQEKVQEMLSFAHELLSCTSTLLFPDKRQPIVDCAIYENWARFDFYAKQFSEFVERIRKDVSNYFPPDIKVAANNKQDITLRTESGQRLLLTHTMLKKLATVLVSYGILPPELHNRFVINTEQFALMQAVRIYLHHTLHNIREAETVGGHVYATYASEQLLRILKELAEHGDLSLLNDGDSVFLTHVTLFFPKEYAAFDGVYGLKVFVEQFIKTYTPEIRMLHELRLREQRSTDPDGKVEHEEHDIIEGNTSKVIERDEEFQRLNEMYQKRIGH